MAAVPDVEYEVFLMRNGCLFSDSHCLGCHRAGHPSLCMSLRTGEWTVYPGPGACAHGDSLPGDAPAGGGLPGDALPDDSLPVRVWDNERVLNEDYHRRTCGLCALWRFEQLGVSAYKVVGRGDDVDDLCLDAALVMRDIAIARESPTEAAYHERMERPRDPATLCGMRGLSCYYPEVRRDASPSAK